MKTKVNSFGSRLVMIGIMILMLAISGCSTNMGVSSGDQGDGQASNKENSLVIARLSDVENLDHHFMSTINAASVTHGKIYEGLVGRDKNAKIKPLLAKEWEQLDDTTWEFKLRDDVSFHDGTPFNAEAVKKTFDRLTDKASSNVEVYRSEGFGTEYVGFNVQKEPFNDVRVRKAISHAVEMDTQMDLCRPALG